MFAGVGDWRIEKGSGNFGGFRLAAKDDKEFAAIVKAGNRSAQIKHLENPVFYNRETEELVEWFNAEVKRRGFKVAS